MGSIFSHDKSPATHECCDGPCSFSVAHVDGNIKTIVRGNLEVDSRSLAFSYLESGNKLRLEWPFSVIRNYGRTTDFIFMIEVGRKSSTGDGFFFFKCRQASGVNDCLERHLHQYQEFVLHRRKCRNGMSCSSRHGHSRASRDKEPSASSSSFSDFAPSEVDSSYSSSRPVSSHQEMPPSGGYVVPVFQRQDSNGDIDQLASLEHDYVNQARATRPSNASGGVPHSGNGTPNYINVQVEERIPPPPRVQRSSNVEYSTVIADLPPNSQLLGNDYSNLPSLDTLPPMSALQSNPYYAEM